MSSTIEIGNLLFQNKQVDLVILPGFKLGMVCPAGTATSPRRTGSATRPTSSPKLSYLTIVLTEILHDKSVAAIGCEDGKVYCEVHHSSSSSVHHIYYDGAGNVEADDTRDIAVAIFLSSLTKFKAMEDFAYTVAATEALLDAYDNVAGIVSSVNELGYLCDCFYYDLVQAYGRSMKFNVSEFTENTKTIVNRMISEGRMQPFTDSGLNGYLSQSFQAVSFASDPFVSGSHAAASTATWMEDCINGKYEIGFDWSATQQEKIRPVEFLDSFVPNIVHTKLTQLIFNDLNQVIDRLNIGMDSLDAIKENYVNAIICGMPGTGKTTTAEALSATLGLPIYTVKNSKYTEEDTFEGMNKVSGGSFAFKSTPFLEGYKNGGIIVLEEFNLADPGVMQGALGQAIEFPFILMEDGCTEVHRHPLCVIIATMNTGTQGAREPNEAFTSRLPLTFVMDEVNEDDLLNILMKKGYEKSKCKKVVKAYGKIIDYLKTTAHSEEMVMCITTRHCIGALKLMSIGTAPKEAIRDTMIGSIAIRDLSLAKDVYQNVVETMAL